MKDDPLTPFHFLPPSGGVRRLGVEMGEVADPPWLIASGSDYRRFGNHARAARTTLGKFRVCEISQNTSAVQHRKMRGDDARLPLLDHGIVPALQELGDRLCAALSSPPLPPLPLSTSRPPRLPRPVKEFGILTATKFLVFLA
jgi:hypothetical protein